MESVVTYTHQYENVFFWYDFVPNNNTFKELLSGKQQTSELHFITATNTHVFIEVKAKVVAAKNVAIFFNMQTRK